MQHQLCFACCLLSANGRLLLPITACVIPAPCRLSHISPAICIVMSYPAPLLTLPCLLPYCLLPYHILPYSTLPCPCHILPCYMLPCYMQPDPGESATLNNYQLFTLRAPLMAALTLHLAEQSTHPVAAARAALAFPPAVDLVEDMALHLQCKPVVQALQRLLQPEVAPAFVAAALQVSCSHCCCTACTVRHSPAHHHQPLS